MEEEAKPKWEGEVTVELKESKAEEVWPLLQDFCNLHKWFPIDTSYHVEGLPGQPGLIRYCTSTITSSSDGHDVTVTKWAKEKLLMIDPIKRCLSYEVLDNNVGFESYVATIEVLPIDDGDDRGCKIKWSFVAEQIEGWRLEDLVGYIDSSLQYMAIKMTNALQFSG